MRGEGKPVENLLDRGFLKETRFSRPLIVSEERLDPWHFSDPQERHLIPTVFVIQRHLVKASFAVVAATNYPRVQVDLKPFGSK